MTQRKLSELERKLAELCAEPALYELPSWDLPGRRKKFYYQRAKPGKLRKT